MWRRLKGERGAATEETGLSWLEGHSRAEGVWPPTRGAISRVLWTSILSKGEEDSSSEAGTLWEPSHHAASTPWLLESPSAERRDALL